MHIIAVNEFRNNVEIINMSVEQGIWEKRGISTGVPQIQGTVILCHNSNAIK